MPINQLKSAIEHNELWFYYDAIPYLVYDNEWHFYKKRFGFHREQDFAYNSLPEPTKKEVKQALKRSRLNIKRGYFLYKQNIHGPEIIPDHGIVASNLYKKDWTVDDVQFLLGYDVQAIAWCLDGDIVIFDKDRGLSTNCAQKLYTNSPVPNAV